MKILRLISLLLDYPSAELITEREALLQVAAQAPLQVKTQQDVAAFVQHYFSQELMDWQQEYDSLFERGRSVSLLLFEHVHGESRDRGQAMVNLLNQYKEAGLDIAVNELPDYIPLYLDFLSTQGADNARLGLAEVAHILALLSCRLEQRESRYAVLFQALLELSQVNIDLADLRGQIANEQPDYTAKALDKVWEEEMVNFMDNSQDGACASSSGYRPSESQRRDQYIPLNTELLNAGANQA